MKYLYELPDYASLQTRSGYKYLPTDNTKPWKRPKFDQVMTKETIDEFSSYGWIGEDTDISLYPLIIDLAGLLLDASVTISPCEIDDVVIVEDGIRYTSFGNAAGGSWSGLYRFFIIQDEAENNQIISLSIFGSAKTENDPKFGNRLGTTVLVVAIDDFDKSHNSLQLNIDKYTVKNGSRYTLWHDGRLTIGNRGTASNSEVMDFVKLHEPDLVNPQNKVILGTFDCSKSIEWNLGETKLFIRNIVKYALVRDKFRIYKQGK